MIKIGVTEAGDAGLDLSWADKLDTVSAAIIITKSLTRECADKLLEHKDKCILHATVTGYGGTVLEPKVPAFLDELLRVGELVEAGFPKEQVVIRVDPIIPTEKGIQTAQTVINTAASVGFRRFRVSIIDMYPHVRARFAEAGLPLPYGEFFSPLQKMVEAVDIMLARYKANPDITIESCAEKLTNAAPVGCVSGKDLDILGVPHELLDTSGYQRRGCLYCSGKTELLPTKRRCSNGCIYCYWK